MPNPKKIRLPRSPGGIALPRNRYAKVVHKSRGVVTLKAMDTGEYFPTLVFKKGTKHTWVVPPLKVPVYWFDRLMLDRKLIVPITDNVFLAAGRRFRVIAQDFKIIGVGYTRWLVYEEAAVPKGGTL